MTFLFMTWNTAGTYVQSSQAFLDMQVCLIALADVGRPRLGYPIYFEKISVKSLIQIFDVLKFSRIGIIV